MMVMHQMPSDVLALKRSGPLTTEELESLLQDRWVVAHFQVVSIPARKIGWDKYPPKRSYHYILHRYEATD